MAELVATHGQARLGPRPKAADRFERIARSIAYQQLAGAAAAAIWGRTVTALGGDVTPEAILAADPDDLRAVGLSGAKSAALRDLAEKAEEGTVRLERLGYRSDDAVVAELTQVRGIGEWTAQMFLIFALGRLDVWPTGDLGVRNGYKMAYALSGAPSAQDLEALGQPFAPYRSVAAWYLWRAIDAKP
jgi:DNA-3-methyladenine glycosylase II